MSSKLVGRLKSKLTEKGRSTKTEEKPSADASKAFCYHCMRKGHFPRDCPVKAAREEERKKRAAILAGEKEKGKKPAQKEKKKKSRRSKKKIKPLEISEGPAAKDVQIGDPIFESMINNNALIRAVYNGNAEEVQKQLKRGADIAALDNNGLAPLHIAAIYGHNSCIVALLSKEADPNTLDRLHSRTPLFFAASFGNLPCIKTLLLAGADPTKACDTGETALDKAKSPSVKYMMEEYWRTKVLYER
eukprot:TRINITY_DN2657_c0_g2_i2.p1 TRINITY_DN2657_c0_g2~~TRINITY_DN2657_c0_g2_i2.p1  ORF type:complete len:246 (+),score=55.25 TRINITY_DN2657_c0_g2_i2:82-819(+)